jgi:hypothetical protein
LKTNPFVGEVGAAPLIFDVPAAISMVEVGVVEVEVDVESEEVGANVEEAAGEWLVVESPPFSPPLLSPDCVGILDCVFKASVVVNGVIDTSLLCLPIAR